MRRAIILAFAAVIASFAITLREAHAEVATPEEMQQVCQSWLSYMVYQKGAWAGVIKPTIVSVDEIVASDGVTILARAYTIAPRGYVVVPVLKELPPIKAYSEQYALDVRQTGGFPQLLREVLEHRADLFVQRYGGLEARQPATGDVLFDRVNREEWGRFLVDAVEFETGLKRGVFTTLDEGGPLLTTAWHQRWPYHSLCPAGDGGERTAVGCVATAVAQIMKYHEWPPSGVGDYTYWWYGDYSCGGGTPGAWLSADFSDAYDWMNMPDSCVGYCPIDQQLALSRLCYEVGVAFEMNYGVCGSGTQTDIAQVILPRHFRYDPALDREDRASHTLESWFNLIRGEIDAGRPMLYTIMYHAIVCDGWRDTGGQKEYHMNYGWENQDFTTWYAIDNLHCPWPGCDPMAEDLIRNIQPQPSTDCNNNGTLDYQDIWTGASPDCNRNALPDECDIDDGSSEDCQADGTPDECQVTALVVPAEDDSCSPTATGGEPWCDDFESYALGSIQGLNGWQGWGPGSGDPGSAGDVSAENNHTPSGLKSLRTEYHDTVHLFEGYNQSASPFWVLRARVYIPSSMSGSAWLILLPDYDGGSAGTTWAVQLEMDAGIGRIKSAEAWSALPLVTDEWVEIRLDINFAQDLVTIFYDGELLGSHKWTMRGGSPNIAAVDLWGYYTNGFYYDDLSLIPTASFDCNGNRVPDECDFGDFDGDGYLGLADVADITACLSGPCGAAPCDPALYADPCCVIADYDHDGDHDLADIAVFLAEFNLP